MRYKSREKIYEAVMCFVDIYLDDSFDLGFFDSIMYLDDESFNKYIEIYLTLLVDQCKFKYKDKYPKDVILNLFYYLKKWNYN